MEFWDLRVELFSLVFLDATPLEARRLVDVEVECRNLAIALATQQREQRLARC
jgi:hypothetical protein